MLDPNLSILVLLLGIYILYGVGYALGFIWDTDKDNRPGPIAFVFLALVWPFLKGAMDGVQE